MSTTGRLLATPFVKAGESSAGINLLTLLRVRMEVRVGLPEAFAASSGEMGCAKKGSYTCC